jgi:excisionase family DNA binding protein
MSTASPAAINDVLHPLQAAADRLAVSTKTIRELARRGEISLVRVGSKLLRVRESEIQRYLDGATVAPAEAAVPAPAPAKPREGYAGPRRLNW